MNLALPRNSIAHLYGSMHVAFFKHDGRSFAFQLKEKIKEFDVQGAAAPATNRKGDRR